MNYRWNPQHLDNLLEVVHFDLKTCKCGAVDVQAKDAIYLEGYVYYNCPRCFTTKLLPVASVGVGIFADKNPANVV